ncbi:hypothetical protein M0R45_019502 [Rubus argutus]|uniref:Uncharacterized protein n=1 Tax=Rubus argutus TaxID=59490 RepID=A0AAW1X7H1_RUBAR
MGTDEIPRQRDWGDGGGGTPAGGAVVLGRESTVQTPFLFPFPFDFRAADWNDGLKNWAQSD